jgi:hypothetical protein
VLVVVVAWSTGMVMPVRTAAVWAVAGMESDTGGTSFRIGTGWI